jgi:hypothetical protein
MNKNWTLTLSHQATRPRLWIQPLTQRKFMPKTRNSLPTKKVFIIIKAISRLSHNLTNDKNLKLVPTQLSKFNNQLRITK